MPISLVLAFMCGLNLLHMVIPTGGSQFTCQVGICTGNSCCLMLGVRSWLHQKVTGPLASLLQYREKVVLVFLTVQVS